MKKEIVKEEENEVMGNIFIVLLLILAAVGFIHMVLFNVNAFNKYIDGRALEISNQQFIQHHRNYKHIEKVEQTVSFSVRNDYYYQ